MLKKFLLLLGIILLIVVGIGYNFARQCAAILGGFASHKLCTNVLIVGRDQKEVKAYDLSSDQNRFSTSTVNGNQINTVVKFGPFSFKHTSIHRPGLGCSNIAG